MFHPQQPRRIVLDNGAIIFLQEDHELPFINGFIEMRGGGRDVPAAKTGMVDLYGDVWRTSGTAKMSGDAMDDLLEAKAAKVETGGDVDSTSVSWSCLNTDFDTVFGLATDLLLHPKFDPGKLDLSKQQMAAGIVRRNDDVSEIASREAAKLVYGATNPYGRTPELAQVMSVTVADLEQFHERTVIPNGMIIGMSGDFDGAAMEQKLRAAFSGLKKGTPMAPAKEEFHGPDAGRLCRRQERREPEQHLDRRPGNRAIKSGLLRAQRHEPDLLRRLWVAVVSECAHEDGTGLLGRRRLWRVLRSSGALLYRGCNQERKHGGCGQGDAGPDRRSEDRAIHRGELKQAKDELLNSFVFRYDTPEKVLNERASLEFYGYPADFLEKYRAAIEKVTTADLERVARKYVDRSKLAVLVVGNVQQIATGTPGQPGKPLSDLGQVHPIDITIPMPPGMQGPPGAQ